MEQFRKEFLQLCNKYNVSEQDMLLYLLVTKNNMMIFQNDITRFKLMLKEDYEVLWDYQPSLEDNEELALAIQHVRDLYDTLLDRNFIT